MLYNLVFLYVLCNDAIFEEYVICKLDLTIKSDGHGWLSMSQSFSLVETQVFFPGHQSLNDQKIAQLHNLLFPYL